MNQIEMRVSPIKNLPRVEWNEEELTLWLSEILSQYTGLVYTDDQLKEAKADKAKLNKLRKALNDERIRIQKEYTAPIDEFKRSVDKVLNMIDNTTAQITAQLDEAEKKRKEEKADRISEIWEGIKHPEWLDLGTIYNDRWLNATYSLSQIETELKETIGKIIDDLLTIDELPEFSFEAKEEYKRTLDLARAIREGQRLADIQKRKEEAERIRKEEQERREKEAAEKATLEAQAKAEADLQRAEEAPKQEGKQPFREWISFAAYMTYEEAMALKIWLDDHNITFKPV